MRSSQPHASVSQLALLFLGLLGHIHLTNAWYITRYYQGEDCRLNDVFCFTQVTPTASGVVPKGTASATSTFEDNLTVLRVIVPTNAPVAEVTTVTATTETRTNEYYYMNFVFDPPKSCESESFELAPFTSEVMALVPDEVTDKVTPTSTYKTTSTAFGTYPASVVITYYIPTTAAPPSYTTPSAPDDCVYYERLGYYNGKGKARGFSELMDDIDEELDKEYNRRLKTYIIVIVVFVCAMFLFGWIEAYLNFSKMMRGQAARSGNIPFFWVGIFGLIPMLFYFCMRSAMKPPKPPHVRKAFRDYYFKLPSGQKIKLFLKYGFIRRRPPILEELERQAVPDAVDLHVAPGFAKEENSTTELVNTPPPAYAQGPNGANRAV